MILLTTPNWWAPYDGHTRLYFPQYLPTWLADRYISWKRPSFLREHSSFAQIRLMSPRQLRKGLALSGLRFLHDLPCGLDRPEYLRHFPLRGVLAYLGFGWYPHAEFWGAAVRRESVPAARLKLRKNWYYEQRQPSPEGPTAFRSSIDFDLGFFNPQLGPGWYWHERERGRGFRWIGHKATCYLETHFDANYVSVRGFSPERNRLQVHVNGLLVGEHDLEKEEDFRLRYLLPFRRTAETIQRVELSCSTTFRPERSDDDRELGTMIFSLGLDR